MLTVVDARSNETVLSKIQIKKVEVDDYSAVRYVHAAALRLRRVSPFSKQEIAAFSELVYSSRYLDALQNQDLYAGWLDGEIVGTAGWCPSGNTGDTARIRSVYVRPLFASMGIGGTLLEAAERRALLAGFNDLSIRATIYSLGFFRRLGYAVTSPGVRGLPGDQDLPVAFMRKRLAAKYTRPAAAAGRSQSASRPGRQPDATNALPPTAAL